MNFEMYSSKKLLEKYLNDYLQDIQKIQFNEKKINFIDINLRNMVTDIVYNHMIFIGKSEDEAYRASTREKLLEDINECLNKEPFSEQEINHVYCYDDRYNTSYPLVDIGIRRYFLELYNVPTLEELIKKMSKEKSMAMEKGEAGIVYESIIKKLSKEFETKKDVTDLITKRFDDRFLKEFNCGGFALEVFDWVDCDDNNPDVIVERIIQNPSVRLLGETKLENDEYLVVLDASCYHFIKEADGKLVEKMRFIFN